MPEYVLDINLTIRRSDGGYQGGLSLSQAVNLGQRDLREMLEVMARLHDAIDAITPGAIDAITPGATDGT